MSISGTLALHEKMAIPLKAITEAMKSTLEAMKNIMVEDGDTHCDSE